MLTEDSLEGLQAGAGFPVGGTVSFLQIEWSPLIDLFSLSCLIGCCNSADLWQPFGVTFYKWYPHHLAMLGESGRSGTDTPAW